MKPDTLVLLSGGLDSTVLLERELSAGRLVGAIHYVYAHPAQSHERRAVIMSKLRIARKGIDIPCWEVDVPLRAAALAAGVGAAGPRIVAARNLAFMALAANWAASVGACRIVLGASGSDAENYPDCRVGYVAKTAELLAPFGLTVDAPLAGWSRAQVKAEAARLGLDQEDVWSCYQPAAFNKPCGNCDSCLQGTTAAGSRPRLQPTTSGDGA